MQALRIPLPDWLDGFLAERPQLYPDEKARMRLALALARENIRHGSGGPFGAALFQAQCGQLLAVGVNLVTLSHCSIAHAEIMALTGAQLRLGDANLARAVPGGCALFSSAEPCAMCLGALPWAGVGHLACAARDADVRAIGFDEGDKPGAWAAKLRRRGITLTRDLLREEAIEILQAYAAAGGELYGPLGD